PDGRAPRQNNQDGRARRHALLQHQSEGDGRQRHDRADRQVNAAGDDHDARPQGEDAVQRQPFGQVPMVAGGSTTLGGQNEGVEDNDNAENADDAFHVAAPPPVARCTTASSLNFSLGSSPAIRPWCMTSTRSLMFSTSSRWLKIIKRATLSRASRSMRA